MSDDPICRGDDDDGPREPMCLLILLIDLVLILTCFVATLWAFWILAKLVWR